MREITMNTFLSELKKQGDLKGFDTRRMSQVNAEPELKMTDEDRRYLREKYTQRLRDIGAWKMINDVRGKMGDMGI